MRLIRTVLLAVVFTGSLTSLAVASADQAPAAATLRGTVLDSMRAPISGARVTATPEAQPTAASMVAVTDANGAFTMSLLPGSYTIHVASEGFGEVVQVVTVSPTGSTAPEFVLQISSFREAVTVSAPAGYTVPVTTTATKTATPLIDVPQSVTIVTDKLIKDQMMMSMGDVMRYVPGVMVHQGENNRDQIIIRGNSSSADFFVDGVRDDVQYYRDLYNLDRVETLKGSNAMIFGRGGGGGVVNRVGKLATFQRSREMSLQAGMYDNRRFTAGADQPLSDKVALRVDGMLENSDSFRGFVNLQRYGLTPTVTIAPSDRTKIALRYEYLNDSRTADRGITSFQGAPADVPIETFYGNPSLSDVNAKVNVFTAKVEHRMGALRINNHTVVGNYDRFYQNFVPGAVTADKSLVALTGYNNATNRTNFFNQTDLTRSARTGRLTHTLLAGAELGHQSSDNFRNTGFFNNTATAVSVPYGNPTISTPVTFRQNATDADNHVNTDVAAAYAQDQVVVSQHVQLVGGLRFDRFNVNYHNNRNNDTLERPDDLVSPRAGVIIKPKDDVSVYGSYSISYLPGSGDQFSSLTVITEQLKPEQFTNYEVGAKWDPTTALAVTTAIYRLNRTNTRSTDPNDPTRIVQTGSQRTNGYEFGINGRASRLWSIAGGYAYQNAFVTSATVAAAPGAKVAQVPHQTLSLWNNYQVLPRLAAAIGVLYRSDMFATIDNTVTLPGYTRVDLGGFFAVTPRLRLQVNVENLLDKRYYINADSNTNISPGFPRTLRAGLSASF